MKKILCLLCVAALGLAACSKNKKDSSASAYNNASGTATANARYANAKDSKSAKDAKYQIIDQEFDNMLAPDTDYDSIPAYELQACGESYLPLLEEDCCNKKKVVAKAQGKAKAKATAKSVATTRAKKVTNTTNIYYVDGGQTVPVSSTTTTKTVYTNGAVSSSSTSSSNTKTRVNADGSVTTTTTY